ncbi:phosphatidylglycerophosphatase A family protein [Nitrosovibrio sp. Nv4]|uniref:phosphatidylglycerophosphatase A family protein n=1 Tax=Nitrosovibrio sp. Nv4 TaxID=1945880 RepID=UPI000BE3C297|nr:phosphatidylglycerophosphatase A [Nitrosovibrio sp. Nv4]
MSDFITGLATGFGLGQLPLFPGTFGALPGIVLAWLILRQSRRVQLFMSAGLIILAVSLCASHTMGGKDDSRIVADEFLTFPAAVAGQAIARHPPMLIGAFFTSRVLDGLKPPPTAQMESVAGGLGIVLDDVATNLYTWLLLTATYAIYRRLRVKGSRRK